jgi:hypothetical protein
MISLAEVSDPSLSRRLPPPTLMIAQAYSDRIQRNTLHPNPFYSAKYRIDPIDPLKFLFHKEAL